MQGRIYVFGMGVLVVGLVGIYIAAVHHIHTLERVYTGPVLHVDNAKSFAMNDIHDVKISVGAAHVIVEPTSAQALSVHAFGGIQVPKISDLTFTMNLKNGMLSVVLQQNDVTHRGQEDLTLDVRVPEQMFHSLQIQSGSGAVTLQGQHVQTTNVETSFGSLSAENMQTDLSANIGTGSIAIRNVVGTLDLQGGSGNVTIHELQLKNNISVAADVGTVLIDTITAPQNIKFELTTQVGAIQSTLPGAKFVRSEPGNVVGYVGQGGPIIQASANDGQVKLIMAK